MNFELRTRIERISADYRSGRNVILLFDYDGTLTPIVERPWLAVLPDHARQILEDLVVVPGVHLGILSGRQLDDLRRQVRIDGLHFAGTSGLELDFAGLQIQHPGVGQSLPTLRHIATLLSAVVRNFCGVWIEKKPIGLTVHFRGIPARQQEMLRERVAQVTADFSATMRIVECALSLEITPNLGWDKGTAIRMIVDSTGACDPVILFAGDSANDADAMAAVRQMGGLAVGVGTEAPANAEVSVATPSDLMESLAKLAWDLRTRCPATSTTVARAS